MSPNAQFGDSSFISGKVPTRLVVDLFLECYNALRKISIIAFTASGNFVKGNMDDMVII